MLGSYKGLEAEEQVVGRKEVKSWGGSVAIIPEIPGVSTTNIVEEILTVYGEKA